VLECYACPCVFVVEEKEDSPAAGAATAVRLLFLFLLEGTELEYCRSGFAGGWLWLLLLLVEGNCCCAFVCGETFVIDNNGDEPLVLVVVVTLW